MKTERGWGAWYGGKPSGKYNQLASELNGVKQQRFDKKASYAIDPSLLNIMGLERNLDPTYVRGSSAAECKVDR